jgi:hypothetical protein
LDLKSGADLDDEFARFAFHLDLDENFIHIWGLHSAITFIS